MRQRRDIEAEIDRWPWERAVQAHFAGGRIAPDGRWIDSHDRPAPPEALDLVGLGLHADRKTIDKVTAGLKFLD